MQDSAKDKQSAGKNASNSKSSSKEAARSATSTMGNAAEFKIPPRTQQARDREALQILEDELLKAKQNLKKLEREAANGSSQAADAAKRVQSDRESIEREVQRLTNPNATKVVSKSTP
jgi:ribosome recycling factor